MHPKHCKSPLQTHLMHPSQHVSYVSPWVVRVDFYGARQTTGPSPSQRDNESLEQRPIACSSNLRGGGARRGQAMTGQGMNLVHVHVQGSTVMQLGRSQWFWGHQQGQGGGEHQAPFSSRFQPNNSRAPSCTQQMLGAMCKCMPHLPLHNKSPSLDVCEDSTLKGGCPSPLQRST